MRVSLKTLRRRYLKAISDLRSARSNGRDDGAEVQNLKRDRDRYLNALCSPSAWYRAAVLSDGI